MGASQTDFLFLKMNFSFPKQEKLKSKVLLEALFSKGKQITSFPLQLVYLPVEYPDEVKCKVAVVAPKRRFKSAVQRNKVKRLLREGYRLNKHHIFNNTEGQYALVILYLGKDMPSFSLINNKMNALFEKFLKTASDEKLD